MSGPLTATEIIRLAGASTLDRFISFVTQKKVAEALINQATFVYPLAQLTVDNTSGWSSVRRNMRIAIGTEAEASDIAILNVRQTPGASTLYHNEVSEGDRGLITRSYTNSFLLDNLNVTIFQMFDYWTALPRVVAGTAYENYDEAYSDFNHLPPPYVEEISFNSYPGHYNTFVDDGQTYATIIMAATDRWWATSSSIASRLWTLPASWTVTGGSLTGPTVTARAPVNGKEPYLVIYEATDNNGKVTLPAYRLVWVYDEDNNYPIYVPLTEIRSDSRDLSHRRMTFTLNGTALSQIPEGAFCVYWERPKWSGLDVATATRSFAGWLLRHDEQSVPGLATARPELVGPMGIARNAPSHYFETVAGTPGNWNQLKSTVAYIDFLLRWIVEKRAPILAQMFGYYRLGVSNLSGRRVKWKLARGTIPSQMRSLSGKYWKTNVGSDSTGAIWVRRHPSTHLSGNRAVSIPIRAHLHAGQIANLSTPRELEHKISVLIAEGYESDGTADTLRRSQAPESPAQGGTEASETDLIFDNQGECDVFAGHSRAMQDNAYPSNSFLIERNYDVFEPVRMEGIALAVPASTRSDNAVWPPLASTETALSVAISSTSATTITTALPLQQGMVIKIDDEFMLITATASLDSTVERGYLDSTPATHLINTIVYRTLYVLPATVTKTHLPGTANIAISGPLETAGFPGIPLAVPTANENVYGDFVPEAPPVAGIDNATHDSFSWLVQAKTKIAATVNNGINYIDITGQGLSGDLWALRLDPHSDWLGPAQAGNLGAWCLTSTGLYYTTNILLLSPTWTQKNTLSPGVTWGAIRPSINTAGVLYATWSENATQQRVARFTNYGATSSWSTSLGSNNAHQGTQAIDIDLYGSDECLVGVRDTTGVVAASVWRILNGTPTRITASDIPNAPNGSSIQFIQKPILKFGGGNNSSTGATESFIYFYKDGNDNVKARYTADGGATFTDITPAGIPVTGTGPGLVISSAIAADNSEYIALITETGRLYTTPDRGANWTYRGADTGMARTLGFFPRQVNSQYKLYMSGDAKIVVSPDFGASLEDRTGDLASVIGSPVYINSVIPLY